MKQILSIINAEPYGKHVFKVKLITDLVVGHSVNTTVSKYKIDWFKKYIQIDETWERLTIGERLNKNRINDVREMLDMKNIKVEKGKEWVWLPALLTPQQLYAGEEPDYYSKWEVINQLDKGQETMTHNEHIICVEYNQAKEQVWFDVKALGTHCFEVNESTIMFYKHNKTIKIEKAMESKEYENGITINQFVIATETPVNENLAEELIK